MSGNDLTIGFIGGGKMGQAIARGLLDAGTVAAYQIIASDKDPTMLKNIGELGILTSASNVEVAKKSKLLILAVKPAVVSPVLAEIRETVEKSKNLIVSIAAGVTIKSIEKNLPKDTRVIRVMPNTPALVGAGATYISAGLCVQPGDLDLVTDIFSSVGICEIGPECLLDAVTGLSGSGPAYIFTVIEALADGGVKMGLPREQAMRLAAQTTMGAAKLVMDSGKHPGELKDIVCSPGGSTIAGVHMLEKAGFRGALIDAVEAASNRATELGKNS